MPHELVAAQAPATHAAATLRRLWDEGAAVLPLAPDAPGPAVRRLLRATRPHRLVVVDHDGRSDATSLPDPLPCDDQVALVIATSGSTGAPKGVELTHAALAASTAASVRRLGCRPGEPWVLALPTHHVAGVNVVLRSWELGTTPVVVDGADPGALAAAGATDGHLALVPTQLARLVDTGADLARFRTVLVGGGPAPPGLLDRARAAGARLVTSYGMTETAGGCVYDGLPLDGVEVAVTPAGRIRLRGAVLARRYRQARGPGSRAITDPDGWFTTGDTGRLVDGRLTVLGRADDVVVTGGENVPASAVTAALRSHPEVADAAAVGVPDPEWGQAVVAVVVAADPAAPPALAALREHVRASLPASHAPRRLLVVDHLPRDTMGKLRHDLLRALAADRSER